jgi:hypothetical protein
VSARKADLDAEQEVDLGRYGRSILARWWLPVAGLLLGALIGYLVSIGGRQVYKASSTVYLGASYSIIGNVQLQGAQAQPATVSTIARSEDSIKRAAAIAGIRPSLLRGRVSTATISSGTGTSTVRTTANPLVRITVQGPGRRRTQLAANALSGIVVAKLSPFVNRKIKGLEDRIASDQTQIDAIRRQAGSASDPTSKAVFAVQLGTVRLDQLQAQQLLIQAQEIERPKVLTHASAVKTTARSKRNSVVVAAFLGLLLGLAAALLWDPLVDRSRRK